LSLRFVRSKRENRNRGRKEEKAQKKRVEKNPPLQDMIPVEGGAVVKSVNPNMEKSRLRQ